MCFVGHIGCYYSAATESFPERFRLILHPDANRSGVIGTFIAYKLLIECHQVDTEQQQKIIFFQNFTFNKLSFYHHVVWSFVMISLDEIISSNTRTRLHITLNFHIGRKNCQFFLLWTENKFSFKNPCHKIKNCSTAYIRSEENERGLWRWWGISTDSKLFLRHKTKSYVASAIDWTSYETNNSNKWGFWTRKKSTTKIRFKVIWNVEYYNVLIKCINFLWLIKIRLYYSR